MCEQRLCLPTFLDHLSVEQRAISGDVIDRFCDSKRIEIEFTGRLVDAPVLRVHRSNKLSGCDSTPLYGELSPPFMRNSDEKAIPGLGP